MEFELDRLMQHTLFFRNGCNERNEDKLIRQKAKGRQKLQRQIEWCGVAIKLFLF